MLRSQGSVVLVVLCLFWTSSASAKSLVKEHSVHTHDGFFFRYNTGVDYAGITAQSGMTMIGAEMSIGQSVNPNVAWYFQSKLGFAPKETEYSNGEGSNTTRRSITDFRLGGSYFMASNTYLEIALGYGFYRTGVTTIESCYMFCDEDGMRERTERVTFNSGTLGVGKEWWVSDNWGIGLAGTTSLLFLHDRQSNGPGFIAGLRLTATYN